VVLAAILCVPVIGVIGITGYFRLSSDTNALRESLMSSAPGPWDKKFAGHVGWLTCAAVRGVSHFFPIPAEPRAALSAVQGAEVAIYNLPNNSAPAEPLSVLQSADRTMTRRGWLRIVGVAREHELVAIYMSRNETSLQRMSCCVAVLKDRELVVVSVRGNPGPLLQLAESRLPRHQPFLAAR
jgi:hypothetical protein